MDWAKEFYTRQNALISVYEGDVDTYHHDRIQLIQQAHPTAKPLLELGAGGGQMAVACALTGYIVTAIELVPTLAKHIQSLADQHQQTISIINADFNAVELTEKFDVITYWDGFGIGSDDDQRRLLKRCADWLEPDGVVLLDVDTPWYWAQAHGQEMQFGDVRRRYTFDPAECRMLDTWWHTDSQDDRVTQSLRCYAPAEMRLLCEGTGLILADVIATGGAINANGQYEPNVELRRAMAYTAKLTHFT